jgi:DUF971 family protein
MRRTFSSTDSTQEHPVKEAKQKHVPTDIHYSKEKRLLTITFDTGETFEYTAEYLRVFSPSAEVRGHAPGQEKLQVGKEDVAIQHIEVVGNYAVSIHFDDNHNSGIYSWEWLFDLGTNQEAHWADYLRRLKEAGHERQAH